MTKFTNNWFDTKAQKNFEKYLEEYKGLPNINFLEIGCYEGRATLWLLENILTAPSSRITVIDTFQGCLELQENDLDKRFIENVKPYLDKIEILTGESQSMLREIRKQFDFVYVDGAHQAPDALEDAVLSFRLLKKKGLMIFDDYTWSYYKNPRNNPKMGIDAFLDVFDDKFEILEKSEQVILRKL